MELQINFGIRHVCIIITLCATRESYFGVLSIYSAVMCTRISVDARRITSTYCLVTGGRFEKMKNTEWIHAWRGKLGTRLDTLIEGVETCNQSKQRNELYPGASVLTPKWMWHVDNMILYLATLVVSENVMLVPNSHSTAKGNVILSSNFPRIRLLYFCQQINVLLPTEL